MLPFENAAAFPGRHMLKTMPKLNRVTRKEQHRGVRSEEQRESNAQTRRLLIDSEHSHARCSVLLEPHIADHLAQREE